MPSLEAKLILLSKQPSHWAQISMYWNFTDCGRAISKVWSHCIIPHSVLNTEQYRPDLHYPQVCPEPERSASQWTHIDCSVAHTVASIWTTREFLCFSSSSCWYMVWLYFPPFSYVFHSVLPMSNRHQGGEDMRGGMGEEAMGR